ncbi:hypothetical protein SAMN04488028_104141 [Reichenbachiella agariperforans]|uniref:Uncharacterized protein n=1 Tax=Reichenbachiella agariperforans TaxID=156994 RepID=A0A1M6REI2_REIAG|nr:hypothetical protein SAMN04488028_104141 [Reichenbachiella agariperforans]
MSISWYYLGTKCYYSLFRPIMVNIKLTINYLNKEIFYNFGG